MILLCLGLFFLAGFVCCFVRARKIKVLEYLPERAEGVHYYGFERTFFYLRGRQNVFYVKECEGEERDYLRLKYSALPAYRHFFWRLPAYLALVAVTALTVFGVVKSATKLRGKLAWYLYDVRHKVAADEPVKSWREAYTVFLSEKLDVRLDGMQRSIAASGDEYRPIETFRVKAEDLNADGVAELIVYDGYNAVWVFSCDLFSGEVYCVCECVCRASLFRGEGSFTCGESPTGGMEYYQEYRMADGRFVAGRTCSLDQCDKVTGVWLETPVLSASAYGEDLDEETYEAARLEMNITDEKAVAWWRGAVPLKEADFKARKRLGGADHKGGGRAGDAAVGKITGCA